MQGNGLAGSSTRLSLVPRTAWCYEQTNEATDQLSGGNAPPDGVIQWAERLWLVPEQKKMDIAPAAKQVGQHSWEMPFHVGLCALAPF